MYYSGSQTQWEEIAIDEYNDALVEATIHYTYGAETRGDLDGNGTIDEDDAIYLLQYVLMPDLFPL